MSSSSRREPTTHDVLFIGPHRADFLAIRECLEQDDDSIILMHWAKSLASALTKLARRSFKAVLLDLSATAGKGHETLSALRLAAPGAAIVVVGGAEDEPARAALKWGAHDYLIRGCFDRRPLSHTLSSLIDRRSMREALFAERDRAEVTLNSIGDAVLCTDTCGRVTYLNPVAEKMTGWRREEAEGQLTTEVFRLVDGISREPVPDPLALAIHHNKAMALSANCTLLSRDGSEWAIEDSVAPIHDRGGRVTGGVIVFHDVSEARAMALKMSHLAQHDFLTDLPNRVLFHDRLSQAISVARRHQRHLAVLFIDCDNFKEINTSLGHMAGDLLLQSVAKRLVAASRRSDTVCRQGGDEFIILLTELESAEDAGPCAEKIILALAEPHRVGQHDLHLTASVGVAVYPADGRNPDSLIGNADIALFEAKKSGRNNYRSYARHMKAPAVERTSDEGRLLRALEREEFRLHYQPRISLATGAVVGVEALIRWEHPDRGLLLPADFVPIAEQCGLIVPIGRWVVAQAWRQAAAWHRAGLALGPVAVNVSAVEFRSVGYPDGIIRLLAECGIDPQLLELEFTESVLMQDTELTNDSLRSLKETGIRLTLDDFGTSFSSLSYLQRFPITTLKIDRSFVRDLSTRPDVQTLVAAIIGLGRSLGKLVIAEGIEAPDQVAVLHSLKCDEGQGFHFCRPLPPREFEAYLTLGAAHAA